MSLKYQSILMALALALLSPGQLHAASFRGKVVNVLGGDTVEVLHDGKTEAVRLAQIYAPVKGQPFGITARNFVWNVAANKIVTVRFDSYDLHGRAVGEVFLADGTNLNKLIVGAGYAWQYEGFSSDPEYADREARARETGLGLWAVKNPVPPWDWGWMTNKASSTSTSASPSLGTSFRCGSKEYCHQMSSCEEAMFYLHACGLTRLDRDGNGVPCELICK